MFSVVQVLKSIDTTITPGTIITATKSNQMLFNNNYISSRNNNMIVRSINICHGFRWEGYIETKLKILSNFVSYRSMINPNELLLFTDSDTYFNSWAISIERVIERFHQIINNHRQQETNDNNNTASTKPSIVVAAEPNCYVGHFCKGNDYKVLYPDSTEKSHCPRFVNSGQYMGYMSSIATMLQEQRTIDYGVLVGGGKIPRPVDDQGIFSLWYSTHHHQVVMDVHASLFRSLILGTVNAYATEKSFYSCGLSNIRCGVFDPPFGGTVHNGTLQIEMESIPGCPTIEPIPFSLHGNGPTRERAIELFQWHIDIACSKETSHCHDQSLHVPS
jgi:hypothetical protein